MVFQSKILKFQFLIGSLKTKRNLKNIQKKWEFQFLIGSLKTEFCFKIYSN